MERTGMFEKKSLLKLLMVGLLVGGTNSPLVLFSSSAWTQETDDPEDDIPAVEKETDSFDKGVDNLLDEAGDGGQTNTVEEDSGADVEELSEGSDDRELEEELDMAEEGAVDPELANEDDKNLDDEMKEDPEFAEEKNPEKIEDKKPEAQDELADEDLDEDLEEKPAVEQKAKEQKLSTDLPEEIDKDVVVEPAAPVTSPPVVTEKSEYPEPEPIVKDEPETDSPPMVESVVDQPVEIGRQPDSPNLQTEQKFNEIYNKFNKNPVPEEQWRMVLGERQIENYTIQKGDTLWGISETFFGDGHFWPKVWSLNKGIANPHLIEPQNTIKFLLGDESDAPAFAVSEGTPEAEEQSEQDLMNPTPEQLAQLADQQTFADDEGVEIPPSSLESRPVVHKLPPSFKTWSPSFAEGGFDELGIAYGRRPIKDVKDTLTIDSVILDHPHDPLGQISEIETGGSQATNYQYVFVNIPKGKAKINTNYIVVQNMGKVRSDNDVIEDPVSRKVGYRIAIQGEIKLVELLPSKEEKFDVFRALVLQSLHPVTVGADIIEGIVPRVNVSLPSQKSQHAAQIIGGGNSNTSEIFTIQSIVFLNRGLMDGIKIGELLPIRVNRQTRFPGSKVKVDNKILGFAKVIFTQSFYSTAIVVKAFDDIKLGDVTGTGLLVKRNSDTVDKLLDQQWKEIDQAGDNHTRRSSPFTTKNWKRGSSSLGDFSETDIEKKSGPKMEAKDENVDEIAGDDDALADELINEVSEDEGAQEEDKSDFAEGQDDDFGSEDVELENELE